MAFALAFTLLDLAFANLAVSFCSYNNKEEVLPDLIPHSDLEDNIPVFCLEDNHPNTFSSDVVTGSVSLYTAASSTILGALPEATQASQCLAQASAVGRGSGS